MFDKPNQLIFYINVILIAFGVLVALLTDYVVIGLIFAICASLLVFDQIRQNKSAFTIADLRKKLTIHDTGGGGAHFAKPLFCSWIQCCEAMCTTCQFHSREAMCTTC